jgi:hypothetical protein
MIQFTRITLLMGIVAGSLAAQTLSFGEITLTSTPPAAPTYSVNIILKTAGTAYTNQIAGLQFDVNYDPTHLTVVPALGAATSGFQINTACVTSFAGCTNVATFNPSTTAPMNTGGSLGGGQRVIVIGCCSAAQIAGTSNVTSATAPDGVVATLNITPASAGTLSNQTLNLLNLAGTSAGGNNVAAASIPLTVGTGGSDTHGTASMSLYNTYLVGDAFPATSNTAPAFGDKSYDVRDVVQVLLAATGLSNIACGTDRYDAMDTFPADSATTRGGDGSLDVRDVVLALLRATGLDTNQPVRTSLGGTCITAPFAAGDSFHPITQARVRKQLTREGAVSFGAAENLGNGQSRVPVYLRGSRDLTRAALAIGVGDEKSQLQFQAAPGLAPSVKEEGQIGAIAAGWLQGLNARAGQELLLGYVVGPAGFAPNLKVFGLSASGLDDAREIGLDVTGAAYVQQ